VRALGRDWLLLVHNDIVYDVEVHLFILPKLLKINNIYKAYLKPFRQPILWDVEIIANQSSTHGEPGCWGAKDLRGPQIVTSHL
jgi:hypothetical protein